MFDTRRERIVAGAGVPVIAVLLYLLLSGREEAPPQVSVAVTKTPVTLPPRPATPPTPVAVAPAAAPQAEAPAISGATLTGVMGGGPGGGSAIFAYAGGAQRLIAVGRDVLPGLALREVRRDRVVLSGPSGPVELTFGRSTESAQARATPAAGSGTADTSAQSFVRALQPQRVAGRVVGYRIRSPADIPLLQRAGLQPGDVLVSVNGNAIDGQERLTGIPAEIAGASAVEVEFDRGGRRMRSRVTTAQQ